MNTGLNMFSDIELKYWDQYIDEWIFVISLLFLTIEIIRYTIKKKMTWNIFGDTLTNYITLYMFIFLGYYFTIYVGIHAMYWVYENHTFSYIPTNIWTILLCVILADLAYYWEHRLMHRIGIGWATHTVYHSSPYFNISVAYRFGPLDGVFPFLFSIPLVLLGFNPLLVFLAENIVQLYQTLLHTEAIGKFPRWIEVIFNTPSHHRVHHGSNEQYLDKNYAGILIIWDKMFGSFEEEQEKVVYGLTEPIKSVNPIIVFFHGIHRLFISILKTKGFINKFNRLIKPPDWQLKHD